MSQHLDDKRASPLVHVAIHPSQFPKRVREELLACLRARRVNHKFHYDSVKQTQQWLALHEAFSPARTDDECLATYDRAYREAAARLDAPILQLIGLGCGGGQKDTRLLSLLRKEGRPLHYIPCDVSTPLVLVAAEAARQVIPPAHISPLTCDLLTAEDLPSILEELVAPGAGRLITFFGMIPNFEPLQILGRLSAMVRAGDHLLFSANLAPGPDYSAGVLRVLPQYDNGPTRDWLLTFLLDLGVERTDGRVAFSIEPCPVSAGLQRITASFLFSQNRTIGIDGERFEFQAGESLRLFFSYRHTPESIVALLAAEELEVDRMWITESQEEGVFLARRTRRLASYPEPL